MYFLKHTNEEAMESDELPEHMDTVWDIDGHSAEDQRLSPSAETTEDMDSWFASDEAGFWMSL